MRRVEALAAAKINLSLFVRSARADGLHPIRGRFQSIDWYDGIAVDPDGEPGIEGEGGRPVLDGEGNLAWRAATMAFERLGRPVSLTLRKDIAVAAGLGGGSADAAAALAATSFALDSSLAAVADLAPLLGSDVPFCFVGGGADVSGVGEVVDPVATPTDVVVGVVVPPIEVSTPAVYAAWDQLGGPIGDVVPARALPPSLRNGVEVRNDLTDAAVDVAPIIADWRSELESAWGRDVLLSGSGPTLFSFFVDADEAADAVDAAPRGARDRRVAMPVSSGWMVRFDGAEAHPDLVAVSMGEGGWYRVAAGVVSAMFR